MPASPSQSGSTLPESLLEHTRRTPDRVAFRFLGDGENVTDSLTYAQLLAAALTRGAQLARLGRPGDRAVLAHAPGLDFVIDLLGCWHAGLAPVPVYPPLGRREIDTARQIARATRPVAVLTDLPGMVGEILAQAPDAVELGPVDRHADGGAGWTAPEPDPDRVALLQFTSGSTGTPRGVVVKHRQLTANQHRIRDAYGTDEASVVVSWLPMYHDMGLIGAVLHPLFLGATAVIMSPLAFLERPVRWLRALSVYQGTISPAPNFAYDLAVRKISDPGAAGLELSRWRVAINGGEPVRPQTVAEFTRHFASVGLRPETMTPSYGLAEGTLLVSAQDATRSPSTVPAPTDEEGAAEPVISCGRPLRSVRIVGSDGAPVPEGALGEIWIDAADPNVGAGYWEQPETTAELFEARAADGSGPYLRTGDLGFIANGELHVAGRSKDVIVVRGRNHFPQDIEATVERADAGIRPGCVAAFADGERLVVVAEVPADGEDVSVATVRAAVARRHGLRLEELVLVRRGTVPKTSSGKIRRRRCHEEYLAGTLARVGREAGARLQEPEADPARAAVGELLGEILHDAGVSELPADDTELAEFGLDSLRSVQVQHALRERFGVEITLERLLGGATVGSLVAAVRERAGSGGGASAVLPAPDREPVASVGQQALWFLEQSSAGASRYTIARAARLVGGVDVRALSAALRDVAATHESLTAVLDVDGEGQVVTRPGGGLPPELTVLDVAAGDVDARAAVCAAEPLDPRRGPLLRATLLRPDDGADPVLVLAVHHVAADLWSLGLLLDQLGNRYTQYLEPSADGGAPTPMPPAPGMSEVAAAERALLSGAQGERLRDSWVEFLADMPEAELRLPLDRPRPLVRTWSGQLRQVPFGAQLSKQVRTVARELRTTPFVVLLACHSVLLARLSGERRFVVGVPTAVRPDARSARVVGYCVNTLPVLLEVPADGSFAELVRETGERLRTALALREYPLPLIAAAVRPTRGAAEAPLFSTMFGWTSTPPGAPEGMVALADEATVQRLRVGGLVLEQVPVRAPAALAELDLSVSELADDELALVLRHATEVLDDATAAGIGERLLRVVAAAVDDPRTAVAALGVLSAGERGRLAELTRSDGPVPEPGRTMIDYFREAVAAHPHAPAIISAAGTVDYAGLSAQVDAAAARIAAAGAGSASCVGVHLEAEPGFVTAMLGAFAAGYGIVPLLPGFPDERLRFTATDAGIGAVLTDRQHAERAALLADGRPVVVLDEVAENLASETSSPAPPARRQDPNSVAYIVHTSGTTGQPKGVPITHANVLPLLLWQRDQFNLGPGTRLPQTLSLSFDFGLQELFTTVLFGAAICIPEPDERLSADAYAQFVRRHEVTILYLTPSFAGELAAVGGKMPSVRCVVLGGELLTYAALQALRPLVAPDAVFVNGYGPTEASINCSMRFLTAAEVDAGAGIVPVGPPTGRSVVTVRDPWDDLTAPGGFGQVVIGGPGVAAGYLNRPAEQGRGFVSDPDAARGLRYLSGDLGSLRPNGDLVLFGRLDDQVKIRGFRVEPQEVCAVLLRQPEVADAVVVVAGEGAGRQLVAAVVPGPGFALDRLRARLHELLPTYQVPGRIVPLVTLPRTAHGKLDRARLDELLAAARTSAKHSAGGEPAWAMERRVAEAWREALGPGTGPIGRDDGFFDLGGHSLLVAPVMTRLGRELGLDPLPLRLLFEYPTVSALAAKLDSLLAEASAPEGEPAADAAGPSSPAPGPRTRRRPPQQIRISFD